MIHSGVQYAQSWTSFNLNCESRTNIQRLRYGIANDAFIMSCYEFLRGVARFTELVKLLENTSIRGKKWEDSHHPNFFLPFPHPKRYHECRKFHMADMRRQRKRKCVRNDQICLLYFSSWTVGLCYACHLVLAVKL